MPKKTETAGYHERQAAECRAKAKAFRRIMEDPECSLTRSVVRVWKRFAEQHERIAEMLRQRQKTQEQAKVKHEQS